MLPRAALPVQTGVGSGYTRNTCRYAFHTKAVR